VVSVEDCLKKLNNNTSGKTYTIEDAKRIRDALYPLAVIQVSQFKKAPKK
jgi:hypothetical protein